MIELQLFETETNGQTVGLKPSQTCRSCVHLFRHEYNADIKYCRKKRQRGTAYGFKKIKSGDPACPLFEVK